LNDTEVRIDAVNRRAIIKVFIDQFLEPLDMLRRNVRIEFDNDAAIVSSLDHGDLRISDRFDAGLNRRRLIRGI
jgi:hypothetical protein